MDVTPGANGPAGVCALPKVMFTTGSPKLPVHNCALADTRKKNTEIRKIPVFIIADNENRYLQRKADRF